MTHPGTPRTGPTLARMVLVVATALVVVLAAGCASDESSSDSGVLLGASEVQGTQAASGTDLLTPAVEGCDSVDGDYLWADATDDDVRSFTRDVDGGAQTTVIGAWPTPEETWFEAEELMTYGGGDCVPDNVSVQGEALGGVSDDYPGWGITASRITYRDEDSAAISHAVRAYGYTQGHMVIVWVDQPGSTPDTDRVVELLNQQAQKITDNT